MANKRYYWLKLPAGYFNGLLQRKMRLQPNGAEMQIVYLKMLLHSLSREGMIYYQGIGDTLEEELAIELDEAPEIVAAAIAFLERHNAIDTSASNLLLPEAIKMTGSEGESAERMRKQRDRSRTDPGHFPDTSAQCAHNVTTEKENREREEIEKEIEIEIIPRTAGERAPNIEPKTDGLWSEDQLLKFIIQNSIQYGVTSASETSAAIWQKYGANGWKKADGSQITNCEQYVRGILKNAKGE